ncbi:MAG: aminoglycoside phosphotransferase family protein [Dehalococcoidia bacterium]
MRLDDAFVRRITGVFGDGGRAWLDALPSIVDEYAARWALTLGERFPLSYNYVVPVTRADGMLAVLKAGVPARELRSEIAALRHYGGRGAVRLLEADADHGVFLLERVAPGTTLLELEDDAEATAIAAGVMRELWRPPPSDHDFPTIAGWAEAFGRLRARFDGGSGPLPARLVEEAERRYAELSASGEASAAAPVVLHGDLHHENILRGERAPWLAIDPKGIVGEPAFEAYAFLRNPVPFPIGYPDAERTLARRVEVFSERLGFERQRIIGWGVVGAVLSACWSVEDHEGGWEPAIAAAELLASGL